MAQRRFTRLTNGFSKQFANFCPSVALFFVFNNFCRSNLTLAVPPAMEAGLTDHVWTLDELLGVLDRQDRRAIGIEASKCRLYQQPGESN